MPPLAILPVKDCGMRGDSVVPNNNGTLLPLHACLQVGTQSDMVVQKLEQVVALFLLEADNAARELHKIVSGYPNASKSSISTCGLT